jgi:hypothetical protein
MRIGTEIVNGESKDIYGDVQVFAQTSVAEQLLPTQSGFFFGSTEYDADYLEDVKQTIIELESLPLDGKKIWYYQSSW